MSDTNSSQAAGATSSEKARAIKLLKDPASPRVVLEGGDLCAAAARPWWRFSPGVMLASAVRPSRWLALVLSGIVCFGG